MFSRLCLCAASFLLFGIAAYAQTPAAMVKCADDAAPSPSAGVKAINGSPAAKASWPWFAALVLDDAASNRSLAFCGGSVIAPRWVLTAAHCLQFIDKTTLRSDPAEAGFNGRLKAVIGVEDLRAASPENTFEARSFQMHGDFGGVYRKWRRDRTLAKAAGQAEPPEPALAFGNDIALIELSRPWAGALAPLPSQEDENLGDGPVSVAGFGTVETYKAGGQIIPRLRDYALPGNRTLRAGCARLMQVTMPLVDTQNCWKRYSEPGFAPAIGAGQLCSGYEEINQDSCNGDSGGPLTADSASGAIRQVGVVSWGASDCAHERQSYGVYTRVASYRDWIESVAGPLAAPRGAEEGQAESFLRRALLDLAADLPGSKGEVRIVIEGGSRVMLGQTYRLEVRSKIAGRLILFDIDAANKITQILPNRFTLSEGAPLIRPGEAITAPSPGWGFTGFQAQEPAGKGTLVALVIPNEFPPTTFGAEAAEQRTKGLAPVQAPASYLMNILQQVSESASRSAKSFAYDTVDYEIVR